MQSPGFCQIHAKEQALRPQPTGLWFQDPRARAMGDYSNSLGLAALARFYVCGLQACPFAAPSMIQSSLLNVRAQAKSSNARLSPLTIYFPFHSF
jgi:hypothetical protein